MRLTILGSNGTYPTPQSPASGYLVQHEDFSVWMDAGSGTFAALANHMDPPDIDAIVLSHAHADHCSDVLAFYYAMKYREEAFAPIRTYAPRSVQERLLAFLGPSHTSFGQVLYFVDTEDGSICSVGAMDMRFARADHPVPTVGVRFEVDGRSLVYSSDTGTAGNIGALAEGADVLLAEATYQGCISHGPRICRRMRQATWQRWLASKH
jgi:ribonuclease BN (tRNA processing enzyme)